MQTIKINKNDTNLRIDNFLHLTFPNLKKSKIYQAIREKKIKVNNKKTSYDYRTILNDEIQIYLPDELLTKNKISVVSNHQDFDVVYEDDNIMIVNKHPGIVVHSDQNNEQNTLINQVINYLINKHEYDPNLENHFCPSLINRLDRNTFGLLIVAKNHHSLNILNKKMKNREIHKFYCCWVFGLVKDKKIHKCQAYLTKNSTNNTVKITNHPYNNHSKKILTSFRCIKTHENYSLLEVELLTGRTHQIRAHLNYLGLPIVGEQKYNSKEIKKQNRKFKHQLLCSYKIYFDFKTPSGILDYLNHRTYNLPTNMFNKYL